MCNHMVRIKTHYTCSSIIPTDKAVGTSTCDQLYHMNVQYSLNQIEALFDIFMNQYIM